MFYTHQLLARKAHLGHIWMAATLDVQFHRVKLNKLDIIKICQEILNASVPMSLRFSGILMAGVVIVYGQKVTLLYGGVFSFLAEMNETLKDKSAPSDPTRLPKGKSKTKYASITLPPNHNKDLGDMDESRPCSNPATKMDFQQTSYFAMNLDSVDAIFLNQGDQEQNHHHHQAEASRIIIDDDHDGFQSDTTTNHFEKFDHERDVEMQQMLFDSAQPQHTGNPPSHQDNNHPQFWNGDANEVEQGNHQSAEREEANLKNQKRQRIREKTC